MFREDQMMNDYCYDRALGGNPVLGIGPMSRNAVNACINVAIRHNVQLMLIASRRQIDTEALGGGYTEHSTTRTFSKYVRGQVSSEKLLLCRDHGGPWQHPKEYTYSCDRAMESCLASLKEDIQAGFDLLHIDTSMEHNSIAPTEAAVDRLVQLYRECHEFARIEDRGIRFEIGFEDQSADTGDPFEFQACLEDALGRLAHFGLPPPTFVVAQTGTKVLETENVGAINKAPVAVGYVNRNVSRICRDLGISVKAHNADYLPSRMLRSLRSSGISAINVAPEFGVTETRAFLRLLDALNLKRERELFLDLAFHSNAWRKWMKAESGASDTDRAIIAGHYVFGTQEFRAIKKAACCASRHRPMSPDVYLQGVLERSIERILFAFSC
jgi:D-tagatose-1,6-bisphosphate aldolase subunit GatZ/KbaZ-like